MNYQFNSIVNKTEADALKEMIFQRVRERAQSMSEDVQSDVMDLARESFVSKDNPFSKIVQSEETVDSKPEEIGFPQRTEKPRAALQNKIVAEQITGAAIQNTMMEARETLSSKKSFMGALNFLNSQAAISLIRTRADKFEIVV